MYDPDLRQPVKEEAVANVTWELQLAFWHPTSSGGGMKKKKKKDNEVTVEASEIMKR